MLPIRLAPQLRLPRLAVRAAVVVACALFLVVLGVMAAHATDRYGALKVSWLALALIGGLWAGSDVPRAVAVILFSSAIIFRTKVALGIEIHTTHLLLALLVVQLLLQVDRLRVPRGIVLPLGAMVLGALVASVAGPDPAGSLFRGAGGLLFPLPVALAAASLLRRRHFERLVVALAAAVAAEGAIALLQLTGHASGPFAPFESGRVNGLFLHPNILGGYLAAGTTLLLGVAVFLWSRSRVHALLLVVPVALGLAGIGATLSRGALIALALGVAVLLLMTARGKESVLLVLLLAAAVAIAVPRVPQSERAQYQQRLQLLFQPGAETGRRLIYHEAIADIRAHPLTGVGPLTFGNNARRHGVFPGVDATALEHAHNIFLEGLLSIGPLGMIGFGALLFGASRRCFRVRRYSDDPLFVGLATGTFAALMTFLASGMFDFIFWQVEALVLLFVLIGAAYALDSLVGVDHRLDDASRRMTSRSRSRRVE